MRAHLLNWVIGPAFLGALFGSFGCDAPDAPPGLDAWLGILGTVAGLAVFFTGAGVILMGIAVVVHRLTEGRFKWAELRQLATLMAVKLALLVFVLGLLMATAQLALTVTGGWEGGWLAAAVGAMVGAAVGLLAGLVVAWLKIPARLGLTKASGGGSP
jgi:hypothetical protein